jgi:hypothetical protein
MKDFNEREDFLLGRALSEEARNKRNDERPTASVYELVTSMPWER